jgi:hypothetical protein
LPYDRLLAPHAQGGYIAATPRDTPVQRAAPKWQGDHKIIATRYVYVFVDQKDCPAINEYIEQLLDVPSID